MVYTDKPTNLEALNDNINCTLNKIRPEILGKVIENWTDPIRFIMISRGVHMQEIIFEI